MDKRKRGGYQLDFTIPGVYWSGTDTIQTERSRSGKRHEIRMLARKTIREAKKQGRAWKVNRFMVLVGVAYPRMGDVTPSRAAETVKPIIDAGTDCRLWPDDDAWHRCATIYFQLSEPASRGNYHLRLFILPVPDSNPVFQPVGGLSQEIEKEWKPVASKPDGWGGYVIQFRIPNRLWISSNLTDSDLKARQQGAHKSTTWGRGGAFGQREKTTRDLMRLALSQWKRQTYWGCERYLILAGISYTDNVGYTEADPDNCAETVNAILQSGIDARAWHGTQYKYCRGVVFHRSAMASTGGYHYVTLRVIPVPETFQLALATALSVENGWVEYDRRRL